MFSFIEQLRTFLQKWIYNGLYYATCGQFLFINYIQIPFYTLWKYVNPPQSKVVHNVYYNYKNKDEYVCHTYEISGGSDTTTASVSKEEKNENKDTFKIIRHQKYCPIADSHSYLDVISNDTDYDKNNEPIMANVKFMDIELVFHQKMSDDCDGNDDNNEDDNGDNNEQGNGDNNEQGNGDNNEECSSDNNEQGNDDSNEEGNDDSNEEDDEITHIIEHSIALKFPLRNYYVVGNKINADFIHYFMNTYHKDIMERYDLTAPYKYTMTVIDHNTKIEILNDNDAIVFNEHDYTIIRG